MSEIYKNTSQVVTLDITGGATATTTPTATLHRGGIEYVLPVAEDAGAATADLERWETRIGIEHTQNEEEFSIVWEFEIDGTPPVEATKTDWYEVITPYVTVADARYELDLADDVSDKDIIRAERKARYIINKYCGQKFGLTTQTITVRGNGTSSIKLPQRLVSITSLKNRSTGLSYGGWSLRNNGSLLHREKDYSYSGAILGTVPISSPYYNAKADVFEPVPGPVFEPHLVFNIEGKWGWERVPTEVREAALLLIEQELCPDTVYRERYINNVASADFRYNIHDRAFGKSTGNVVADQILKDYSWDSISLI